jgi:acyl-CoA synthetase (AMP-forming)/AMP-acid ligase II
MRVLGLWSVSLSLIAGGTALLVDSWEPRRVARLLAEAGMEQMILVPSFLGELLAVVREDGIRLPRLREITVGAPRSRPSR